MSLTVAFLLAVAAPASAGPRERILADCTDDGQLQGTYTRAELRDARHNMTSEIAEYTNCGDVIRRAELREAGGDGAGPTDDSSGRVGATPVSPLLAPANEAERALLTRAEKEGGRPVRLDGKLVRPGAASIATSSTRELPLPMLITVLALAFLTLTVVIPAVARRARATSTTVWRR